MTAAAKATPKIPDHLLTSAGRPKEDRVQVLGNHPSAAFGQALPYHRRGRTAAETMGCAMGGLDVPDDDGRDAAIIATAAVTVRIELG